MVRYPGGTALDRASHGYSLTHNFLSDLGMTVAYDGQPNRLGALLFVLSLCVVVLGLGGCLLGFVRLYSRPAASLRWARAAGAVGFLVCAAFVGVAVTPENEAMTLHVGFTLFAFRVFPLASCFLAIASLRSKACPRRVTIAWAALTLVLVWYVGVLGWGPGLGTPDGLMINVIAQKIVAILSVSIIVYLSVEADRVMAAARDRD